MRAPGVLLWEQRYHDPANNNESQGGGGGLQASKRGV